MSLTREEMIDYLQNHPRYYVLNPWNHATSYAHNVKLYRWVPTSLLERAYELLEVEDPYYDIQEELQEFARKHEWRYQIGFNGRNGGYLVLRQGGRRPDGSIFIYPGRGLDENEVFEDWDDRRLMERSQLVKDFDTTVEKAKERFLYYCKNFKVVEVEEAIVQRYKIIEPLT